MPRSEAGRLHRRDVQRAAQLVDHQRGERLTFDVLGDDEQRFAHPRDLLEDRQQILHRADLLLVDENHRILEHHFHPLRVRHEVGRQVPAVELHPLDHLERGLERLGFFDRDDAVFPDLLHRLGDDLADGLVVVRRDRPDLRDHVALDRLRPLLEVGNDRLDRALDAPLEVHRVRAGRHHLRALAVERLRQHRRRRRAVTGHVRRLARHFADHLRAHVLERIGQLDFLRDRHAVLGDQRRSELLVEHDVPALRPERHLDRVGQLVHAAQDGLARLLSILNLFSHYSTPWTAQPSTSRSPREPHPHA
jgi:hypothetical protein